MDADNGSAPLRTDKGKETAIAPFMGERDGLFGERGRNYHLRITGAQGRKVPLFKRSTDDRITQNEDRRRAEREGQSACQAIPHEV